MKEDDIIAAWILVLVVFIALAVWLCFHSMSPKFRNAPVGLREFGEMPEFIEFE